MTLIVSNALQQSYLSLKVLLDQFQKHLLTYRGRFQAGTNARDVYELHELIRHTRAKVQALPVSALAQYARDQEGNQGYDLVAEMQALNTAASALQDALLAALPTDANGWRLVVKLTKTDGIAYLDLTPAELADAITAINGVLARYP